MTDPFSGNTTLVSEIRFVLLVLALLAAIAAFSGCVTIGAEYCEGDRCVGLTVTP